MATASIVTGWAKVAVVNQVGQAVCAAGGQTADVVNALVSAANSIVIVSLASDDATAKSVVVSAQIDGQFTVKFNAAPTGQVKVNFVILGLS